MGISHAPFALRLYWRPNVHHFTPLDIDRFWAKVDRRNPDDCWHWTASLTRGGYGHFSIRKPGHPRWRITITGHRVSWVIAHGPVPKGLCVCHTCDNRACVNPAHLFLGTQKENLADMHAKGRANRPNGERMPNAKINEGIVHEIRHYSASGMSQRKIARLYGISRQSVVTVLNGKRWKHVPQNT